LGSTVSDELRFDGRVVMVTGAGRGIGRQHALRLASRGAHVVVNDLGCSPFGAGSTIGPAEDVVSEIRGGGGVAIANGDSVATESGVAGMVGDALEAFGRIDAVVHNAGVVGRAGIEDVTPAVIDRVFRPHLLGAFLLAKAVWPSLAAHRSGRMVLTTSAAALLGMERNAPYAAMKLGVVGLAKSLAREGAPLGIGVNVLSPAGNTRLGPAAQIGEAGWSAGDDELQGVSPSSEMATLAASVACWLAHQTCPLSGEVVTAAGRRVARVVIGETTGVVASGFSPEDVRDWWAAIGDPSSIVEPGDLDEWASRCQIPDVSSRFLKEA
jgi:NAD(P)-dependent dehydrogenase (short-subunit alcohol dehydrogenase family)